MLDLLEIPLKRQGFRFVRLDGTMTQRDRERVLRQFATDPKVSLLLVSLLSGGVGLNLVAASNVFFLDSWWNPAAEEQAIQRVHRIGQTKPVHVYRFIVRKTVEERILDLQSRKKMLAASLGVSAEEIKRVRIDELKSLFLD